MAALAPILLTQPAAAAKKKPAEGQQQNGEKKDDKMAYEPQFPTKFTWVLSSVNGKAPPAEATLLIDENLRGTGTSGCNGWSAALYPVKGRHLAMGPVAITKKTCSPEIKPAMTNSSWPLPIEECGICANLLTPALPQSKTRRSARPCSGV